MNGLSADVLAAAAGLCCALVSGAFLVFSTFVLDALGRLPTAGNVPLNDRLAAVGPDGDHTVAVWQHYLRVWTSWNHVRTVAALVAAVLFLAPALVEG